MDTAFFIASKIFWGFARPESWLVLLAIWAAVRAFRRRSVKIPLGILTGALLAIGFLPLGDVFLSPLENRHPVPKLAEPDVHGIIILGGPLDAVLSNHWDQPLTEMDGERFFTAAKLGHAHPNAQIVFTGGSGALFNQDDRGGPIAGVLLQDLGLDADRITVEGMSRNTYENAVLTKAMVNPAPGQTWILVTSAFHMPRSKAIFDKQGWDVVPYPTDYRTGRFWDRARWDLALNLQDLNIGVREWIGIIAYWSTGRANWPF